MKHLSKQRALSIAVALKHLSKQRALSIAVPTALVLAVAIGLVVLAVGKSVVLAFIAAGVAAATIGTLLSLEIGIFALILIACTDGMLKGLYPGWYTQVLKDYFLVLCMLRWGWLSVLGHRRLSVRHPIVPALLVFAWLQLDLGLSGLPGVGDLDCRLLYRV